MSSSVPKFYLAKLLVLGLSILCHPFVLFTTEASVETLKTTKQTLCAAALLAIGNEDRVLRKTAEKTDEALAYLSRFQDNHLGAQIRASVRSFDPSNVQPSIEPIEAAYDSKVNVLKKMGQRLEGLLRFGKGAPEGSQAVADGRADRDQVFALLLRGEDKINGFIKSMEGILGSGDRTAEYSFARSIFDEAREIGSFSHVLYQHPWITGHKSDVTLTSDEINYYFYKLRVPEILKDERESLNVLGASKRAYRKLDKLIDENKLKVALLESQNPQLQHRLDYIGRELYKSKNHIILSSSYSIYYMSQLPSRWEKNNFLVRAIGVSEFKKRWEDSVVVYRLLFDKDMISPINEGNIIDYSLFTISSLTAGYLLTSQWFSGLSWEGLPAVGLSLAASLTFAFAKPVGKWFNNYLQNSNGETRTTNLLQLVKSVHESGEFSSGRWIYSGQNLTLSKATVKYRESLEDLGLSVYWEDGVRRLPVLGRIIEKFAPDSPFKVYGNEVWTGMDLLYFHDEQLQVPTLTLALWTSVNPPNFKKGKPRKLEVPTTSSVLDLIPQPVSSPQR